MRSGKDLPQSAHGVDSFICLTLSLFLRLQSSLCLFVIGLLRRAHNFWASLCCLISLYGIYKFYHYLAAPSLFGGSGRSRTDSAFLRPGFERGASTEIPPQTHNWWAIRESNPARLAAGALQAPSAPCLSLPVIGSDGEIRTLNPQGQRFLKPPCIPFHHIAINCHWSGRLDSNQRVPLSKSGRITRLPAHPANNN